MSDDDSKCSDNSLRNAFLSLACTAEASYSLDNTISYP